ncbi:hypothetical protein FJZ26_02260 [Candidatus Parvarchaeota archaeon]|nr:hypothetical protein [Candidatus Parvarchaeota archaeon]
MVVGKARHEKGGVVLEFGADAQGLFAQEGQYLATAAADGKIVLVAARQEQKAQSGQKQGKEEKAARLSEKQLEVLNRLITIRFENRLPEKVASELDEQQRKVLEQMVKDEIVLLYRGGKYQKTGVYSIPDSIYPHIPRQGREAQATVQAERPGQAQQGTRGQQSAGVEATQAGPRLSANSFEHLEKYGYMVLENELEAKRASESLAEKIRLGQIKGVRLFDRKFYIATAQFYEFHREGFLEKLGKAALSAEQAAKLLEVEAQAAKVMLALLSNEGEAIEKKRGTYAKA